METLEVLVVAWYGLILAWFVVIFTGWLGLYLMVKTCKRDQAEYKTSNTPLSTGARLTRWRFNSSKSNFSKAETGPDS